MTRAQTWHRSSTCQPWEILKMTSMNHETTRKSQIEQVIFRRSAREAENASPLVPDEQHRFRPWGDEIREIEKNDEFKHVKMPPLSILNEKTALELTSLLCNVVNRVGAKRPSCCPTHSNCYTKMKSKASKWTVFGASRDPCYPSRGG